MVPYINPAKHATGVQICHTLGVIFYPGLIIKKVSETITSGEQYRLIESVVVDYFAWIIGLKYVYSVIKGLSELKDQSSFIICHQGYMYIYIYIYIALIYMLTLCMVGNFSCFCSHLLPFFKINFF